MSSISTSPRGSDISFTSFPSTFSVPPPKPASHPTPTPSSPPCVSTSTLSRSSTSSASPSSPSPTFTHISSTHLLDPLSSSRLPKARVFVERRPHPVHHQDEDEQQQQPPTPDRPRANSAHPRRVPRPFRPLPPTPHHHRQQPRCVSDLHEAFRARRGAAWEPVLVEPPELRSPEVLAEEARGYVSDDDPGLPPWLPEDERRDWAPSETIEPEVEFDDEDDDHDDNHPVRHPDPCDDTPHTENRWVGSLRNLSHLGVRNAKKERPPMRGSVLDIRPPSVRERFGVRARGRRAWAEMGGNREERADAYDGFLLKADVRQEKKGRRMPSWLRFFRRSL